MGGARHDAIGVDLDADTDGAGRAMSEPRLKVPLVLILVLVIHVAVMGHIRIAGVAPDIMLLLAIAAGLVGGPDRGAVVGFFSGLAVDLVVATTPLGLSAFVFCLVGYTVGVVETGVLRSSWWIPVVTAAAASAAGEAAFALSGAVVGQTQLVGDRLPVIIGVVALLNGILARPTLWLVHWAMTDSSRSYAA